MRGSHTELPLLIKRRYNSERKKAAESVGISEHTIRYYDKSGLFPFVERDKNGHRNFKIEDLYWLEFIKCMRQTHMPISKLKEIAELYEQGRSTVLERKKIFIEHQENLIKQKELIDQALKTLDDKFKLLEKEGDY
ncbi:MerR family transcriptional regulator [Mammaliicoccus sciuri]|nr:MerR family transcriptional regulator [Mammaliicoccus sciuri]